MSTWRSRLAPIIAEVLAETQHLTLKERRRALRLAWHETHLGERAYWPYQVWQQESRRQLGHKKPGIGRKSSKGIGQASLPLGAGKGEGAVGCQPSAVSGGKGKAGEGR